MVSSEFFFFLEKAFVIDFHKRHMQGHILALGIIMVCWNSRRYDAVQGGRYHAYISMDMVREKLFWSEVVQT